MLILHVLAFKYAFWVSTLMCLWKVNLL